MNEATVTPGKLWGVGLGPGDPELVTVKAARVIDAADVIAFHSARHGRSISRGIAQPYMREGQLEEHLVYPVTTETTDHPGGYQGAIDEFYEQAARRLAEHLAAGRSVALLAAGDPLFYSSYMHMHRRLADRFDAEIVPGITSVSAASAALATPLVEGEQVLTVLPATLPTDELTRRLRDADAAAIMKLGRTYPGVRQALSDSGKLDRAYYVERASSTRQRVLRADAVADADVPYFAITLVPGPEPTAPIRTDSPNSAAEQPFSAKSSITGNDRSATTAASDTRAPARLATQSVPPISGSSSTIASTQPPSSGSTPTDIAQPSATPPTDFPPTTTPPQPHSADSAATDSVRHHASPTVPSAQSPSNVTAAQSFSSVSESARSVPHGASNPLVDGVASPTPSASTPPNLRTTAAEQILAEQPRTSGAPTGRVVVVGLGPGDPEWTTAEVRAALAEATDLVGYTTYLNRVPERVGQRRHASDNRVESERAAMALDLAGRGARVAVVSSGDPGVFAMAAAVLEESSDPRWQHVSVQVLPGLTAANAVASRVGAPLGHDYATISLSDRLKPWEVVAQRLSAVAAADMAIAVYNPASSQRTWQVGAMRDLLLEHRKPDTPVVVGRDVGGPTESVRVVALGELDPAEVDMRTLLIIGASTTAMRETEHGPLVYTSRRYGGVRDAATGGA
ncbi:precorrin-2 C(20)-methyltransferase [Nocardia callitridis]|uniref:Tetrapyrrole methylase domain-containing protein n=1 Tax=Nocardia callitridis TaxID=648753 RepID=A0ABP9KAE2_9NOCA